MGDTFSIAALLRLLISLALLIGALYAVKYWQRRPGAGARRGSIDVVARASLGRSSSVHIVDVGDRRFLIGSGEHQVNLLSELDRPPTDELDEHPPGDSAAPEAGEHAQVGGRRRRGTPDGSGDSIRSRPRMSLMDWLRAITARTPQQVRVIRDHAD
ncbi:MAG: flagellar biosynthetic protein FliO [Actinomycetota bacterium]|jgi:flagellar protein FliO/FliZ|nr:flagellar biosynthetic protein FliO [Actinomycetota bacterium]